MKMDSKSKLPYIGIKVPDVEWETTGRYVRPPASNTQTKTVDNV